MPMQWMAGHLAVPVKINDRDAKMVLATGDAMTMISQPGVKSLGLRTEDSNRRVFAGNGGIGDINARVDTMNIGAMSGSNLQFLVMPNNTMPPSWWDCWARIC